MYKERNTVMQKTSVTTVTIVTHLANPNCSRFSPMKSCFSESVVNSVFFDFSFLFTCQTNFNLKKR